MFKFLKFVDKKNWLLIAILIGFTLLRSYCDVTIPDYIQKITSLITQKTSSSQVDMWSNSGIMFVFILADFVSMYIIFYTSSYIIANLSYTIRDKLFKKINSFSNNEINKFSIPSLITRTTNDIVQVQNTFIMIFRIALAAPFTLIFGIIKISSFSDYNSTLLFPVAFSIALVIIFSVILIIFLMPKYKVMQTYTDELNNSVRNQLTGIRVVRAFNAQSFEKNKFGEINDKSTKLNIFTNTFMGITFPIILTVMNLMTLSLYWLGISQNISLAVIVSTSSLAMILFMSFLLLIMLLIMVPRGIISAKRINEILNIKNSIIFPEQSQPISDFSSLKFNDVSFYHENAKEPTLKNISFTLNKNETIAIIGSNGSGKTTIIELIERFYDCTSGNIEINGFDIKTLSKKNLSQLFALVPQKHKLFNDTVKKNISFGSNLVSNEQIEEIKTIASLDFIDKYENKFEYKISQNGKNLSGGQKQRIAIARAISKKTPVILFDDSFSALDFKTDASIRKNMHEKLENKTKIIVASRISTVLNADKIIVLNNGAIEGIGTADELLKNCETYQQIFYSQISSKEVIN